MGHYVPEPHFCERLPVCELLNTEPVDVRLMPKNCSLESLHFNDSLEPKLILTVQVAYVLE